MRWLVHHGWHWLPFVFLQFGFDFTDFTDALAAFYGAILDFLLQVVQFIWAVLVYVANYIWAALNWLANFFYGLMQDIARAFKWIWDNIIKVALTKLVSIFLKVRQWLQDTFQPLIDFLKKLRAWFDRLFNLYVRPILNLIRHLRQFLTIFRLLGFKWAKRLDADLAAIEQKIVQVYTFIRAQINTVISYLDLIVDPLGILRRNPLFAALISSVPELQNLLLQATQRPLLGNEVDSANQDARRYTATTQKSNFTDYYSKGQLDPCKEASRQMFLENLKAIQDGANATSN